MVKDEAPSVIKKNISSSRRFTFHQRNLQVLITEVYKMVKDEAPCIIKKILLLQEGS